MFLLDMACKPIQEGVGDTYHVGTSADGRHEYRDVDVRTILADERFDLLAEAIEPEGIAFLGLAIGQYLHSITGMPIDYQIQRQTEANERHDGIRNPLGMRDLRNFRGDAVPNN
jgi:hypothetical protein